MSPLDHYGRDWCLVPDCDEAPEPGEQFCLSHLRELDHEVGRWRAAIQAYEAGDPFPVLEMFESEEKP